MSAVPVMKTCSTATVQLCLQTVQ
uniref:Uncharacterized protein n=1 Tax=Anguilla anguilla TaxID=7936 RepID=A0A0E9W0S6_ANGAN